MYDSELTTLDVWISNTFKRYFKHILCQILLSAFLKSVNSSLQFCIAEVCLFCIYYMPTEVFTSCFSIVVCRLEQELSYF